MATELLAPAGNREKMQVACRFGADAVYVGGKVFGLRKYADNFTDAELAEAVAWVHQKGKKIYVVLNGFAHDDDLRSLRPHLAFLDHIQPDAVIVSDWAVAEQVLTHTRIPL
ncbi:U32 family peptidase, partial [bacterium]|nr:U32 family peptidase [bacterium]